MNVSGHFGLAEWLSVAFGALALLFVMLTCPRDRRGHLAFGAFSTGAAVGMFLLLAYALAVDEALFSKTVSTSGVPVFGALIYSAFVSARSLWDMRDQPRRYFTR